MFAWLLLGMLINQLFFATGDDWMYVSYRVNRMGCGIYTQYIYIHEHGETDAFPTQPIPFFLGKRNYNHNGVHSGTQ